MIGVLELLIVIASVVGFWALVAILGSRWGAVGFILAIVIFGLTITTLSDLAHNFGLFTSSSSSPTDDYEQEKRWEAQGPH
jgi:hypothetical protein